MEIIVMLVFSFAALFTFSAIAKRLNRSVMIDEMLERVDDNITKQGYADL